VASSSAVGNLAVAYDSAVETNGSQTAPESSEAIVRAKNLTVAYRSYKERATSMKESLVRLIKHGKFRYYSTFDALSDVSFTVERGTVYGLIGSNGSGKSTLLKVLAGVLTPTHGSLEVNGSVASLIDIGIGFDPELNAIENIYLNGSLYRRTRAEIKDRVEHILQFAELTEFATTPVKYYSAGMFARLGFSVAIDINPDILLVDEVLAVGDERFQAKCREVFNSFIESKKTIIIVSHDMRMLQETASRIGVLSCGKLIFDGSPNEAVEVYRDSHYQTRLGHAE
jgi:ABC-type polysaccharide/polyol phosphate transport system ATPase subunit